MSPRRPAVSVVLPFRDAAITLVPSVRSILVQTFTDFELLCIDDGSRDGSAAVVRALARRDPRVRLVPASGRGLVGALNDGIATARAPLIARMDADDVALPRRLRLQHDFLARNPEVSLVACRVIAYPAAALGEGMRHYLRWQDRCLTPRRIACEIYQESPIVHPTAMFRTGIVRDLGGYLDGAFPEDYELWLRMHAAGCALAKLPQRLLRWRQSDLSHSRTHPRYAREAFDALRARYLSADPRLHRAREIVIWGAGRRTRKRVAHLLERGVAPTAWIDIDPRKIGQQVQGLPVHAPRWLRDRRPRPVVLGYVASHGAQIAIRRCLRTLGYRPGEDYLPVG